jgi:hypothetical protein
MKANQIIHVMGQSIWLDHISRDLRRSGRLIAIVCLTAACAFAQTAESHLPVTDPEKIADALRAGPTFITKEATLLDWPSSPKGEYRVLRKGTNEWTCLPAIPGYPHDEPGCFDRVFFQWMKDSMAGRTPQIDRIGISYMYLGAWKSAKDGSSGHEFHVGPHLMIVGPHQDGMNDANEKGREASNFIEPTVMNNTIAIPETFPGVGYTKDWAGIPLEAVGVPVPQPGADQVLNHVAASSLNPVEYKLADLN